MRSAQWRNPLLYLKTSLAQTAPLAHRANFERARVSRVPQKAAPKGAPLCLSNVEGPGAKRLILLPLSLLLFFFCHFLPKNRMSSP
jgi:hypothetical protein